MLFCLTCTLHSLHDSFLIMATAIYPGTFDPVTSGHLDILNRACHIFDRVIVGVAYNLQKKPLFTAEERIELIASNLDKKGKIEVMSFDGLVVDFARQQGASVLIRGLRAVSDFEFEFRMALANHRLSPDIEYMALITAEEHTFLSSTTVREIASRGGDVSSMVPPYVEEALKKTLIDIEDKDVPNSIRD